MKTDNQRLEELEAMAVKIEIMVSESDHMCLNTRGDEIILCSYSSSGKAMEKVIDMIPF